MQTKWGMTVNVERNRVLFQELEDAHGAYLVRDGIFAEFVRNTQGDHVGFVYTPGDLIGTDCLAYPQRNSWVKALTLGSVRFFMREELNELIDSDPRFRQRFVYYEEVKIDLQRLGSLYCNSWVRARLADCLLYLDGIGCLSRHGFSRWELAALIRSSTESVIREISGMKEEKLVDEEGRRLAIRDRTRLAEEAEPMLSRKGLLDQVHSAKFPVD